MRWQSTAIRLTMDPLVNLFLASLFIVKDWRNEVQQQLLLTYEKLLATCTNVNCSNYNTKYHVLKYHKLI